MDGSIGWRAVADHGNSHKATAYDTGRRKNLALAGTLLNQNSELVCVQGQTMKEVHAPVERLRGRQGTETHVQRSLPDTAT
jgi:hypothetical protein